MSAAKLLLVEDDPSLSELLEYRFQNEGYDVRCTADGDEAKAAARSSSRVFTGKKRASRSTSWKCDGKNSVI